MSRLEVAKDWDIQRFKGKKIQKQTEMKRKTNKGRMELKCKKVKGWKLWGGFQGIRQ